jgi:hypothetical protein
MDYTPIIPWLAGNPYVGGLASAGDLICWAGGAVYVAGVLWFAWTLWCWHRGIGLDCIRCGGPLGGLHDGRYSVYRRCWNCGARQREPE